MLRASLNFRGNLSTRLRKYCHAERTYSAWGGAIRQGHSVDDAYTVNPLGVTEVMDSTQHCRDQSAECLRLIQSVQSEAEAEVLRNLSQSWSRLAGQIDRYSALMRDQDRAARRKAVSTNNPSQTASVMNVDGS